jgi:hypothetical protein
LELIGVKKEFFFNFHKRNPGAAPGKGFGAPASGHGAIDWLRQIRPAPGYSGLFLKKTPPSRQTWSKPACLGEALAKAGQSKSKQIQVPDWSRPTLTADNCLPGRSF